MTYDNILSSIAYITIGYEAMYDGTIKYSSVISHFEKVVDTNKHNKIRVFSYLLYMIKNNCLDCTLPDCNYLITEILFLISKYVNVRSGIMRIMSFFEKWRFYGMYSIVNTYGYNLNESIKNVTIEHNNEKFYFDLATIYEYLIQFNVFNTSIRQIIFTETDDKKQDNYLFSHECLVMLEHQAGFCPVIRSVDNINNHSVVLYESLHNPFIPGTCVKINGKKFIYGSCCNGVVYKAETVVKGVSACFNVSGNYCYFFLGSSENRVCLNRAEHNNIVKLASFEYLLPALSEDRLWRELDLVPPSNYCNININMNVLDPDKQRLLSKDNNGTYVKFDVSALKLVYFKNINLLKRTCLDPFVLLRKKYRIYVGPTPITSISSPLASSRYVSDNVKFMVPNYHNKFDDINFYLKKLYNIPELYNIYTEEFKVNVIIEYNSKFIQSNNYFKCVDTSKPTNGTKIKPPSWDLPIILKI